MAILKSALVLDGNERTALVFTRSLGSKGVRVCAADCLKSSIAGSSKYCSSTEKYPSPELFPEKFAKWVEHEGELEKFDAAYPLSDFTTLPLAQFLGNKLGFKSALPPKRAFLLTHQKDRVIELAGKLGIPVPKTLSREELERAKFRVVVRPSVKTKWVDGRARTYKVSEGNYFENGKSAVFAYDGYLNKGVAPIAQEWVAGDGFGVEVLMNRGEPRAVFAHKRLREYPITGGASTLRESVKDDEMTDYALRILKHLNWHGLAMVEFKKAKGEKPKLIEINGRAWGSIALAVRCGIDFPYLLHEMVSNGDVKPKYVYKLGVRQRWGIPGDLLCFAKTVSKNPFEAAKFSDWLDPKVEDDIFSIDDPKPTLSALMQVGRNALDVISGKKSISGEMT